eukprot:gene10662-14318_t
MSLLKEQWLQDVVDAHKIAALHPTVAKSVLLAVEMQLRKAIQQANKFQRRSKCKTLLVEHINNTLIINKLEPLYGINTTRLSQTLSSSAEVNATQNLQTTNRLRLADLAAVQLPPCPLAPDLSLHWLAVNGNQPLIPENPCIIPADSVEQPTTLPNELQNLFARITGIIISCETSPALLAVFKVFEEDAGIQELMPYMSRFFYHQIKSNTKRVPLLSAVIRSIKSLLKNNNIDLKYHLQQLLPAIFTCIIAAKLSADHHEDHWILRENAAEVIAIICSKYSDAVPDLQARICKTYVDALSDDKMLTTTYGGIVGLDALGYNIIKNLLIKELPNLHNKITKQMNSINNYHFYENDNISNKRFKKSDNMNVSVNGYNNDEEQIKVIDKCRMALLHALGKYMITSLNLPLVPILINNQNNNNSSTRMHLCDLEESLVPYYATKSNESQPDIGKDQGDQ